MTSIALLLTGLFTLPSQCLTIASSHRFTQVSPQQPDTKLSSSEQQLLDLVNAERKKVNAPALNLSPLLLQAARLHSRNMAHKGELNHELDSKGPAERLTDLGYQWAAVAETSLKDSVPAQVIRTWMNSELHRTNLQSTQYKETGIALAKAKDGSIYWTVVFAKAKQVK